MKRIHAVSIGKAYRAYPHKWGRAYEWLGGTPQHSLHWVLRDVNVEVTEGECVGIIGLNGAGKSTLLKVLSGVTKPTTGEIHRSGSLSALLELGMGFHPDFSGRQNAFMAGQLHGLSQDQILKHMAEIESFAEIGSYIDVPVRTYSSGMHVRLAFSVATAVRPEVLIIDEALAVGDIQFQQKCYERIQNFRKQGTALLLVSHSIQAVLQLCTRAILLRNGRVAMDGDPKVVTDLYQSDVLVVMDKRPDEMRIAKQGEEATGSVSTSSVTVLGARFLNSDGMEVTTLTADTSVRLELQYAVHRDLDDPHIGFKVRDKFGVVLFETNSYCMHQKIGQCTKGTTLIATFEFRLLLAPGDYTVTSGFANHGFAVGSFEEALSYQHNVLAFSVAPTASGAIWAGLINLEPKFTFEKGSVSGRHPYPITIPGLKPFNLYVHRQNDKYISAQIRECGCWEPFESSLVLKLLSPGDVFLDLGANIGYYSVLASLICGSSGKVYAFEPEPSNFALLKANLALNKTNNVLAINAATAAASGFTSLYLSVDNQGDHRTYANDNRTSPIKVPTVALDEWFIGRDNRINFVKIDTQGSEAKILDGMLTLIEANRDRMRLIIEYWPFGLEAAGDSAEGLVDRLQRFNFDVHKIDESARHVIPTSWFQLVADAQTIYHPSTQQFTNLLLTPKS